MSRRIILWLSGTPSDLCWKGSASRWTSGRMLKAGQHLEEWSIYYFLLLVLFFVLYLNQMISSQDAIKSIAVHCFLPWGPHTNWDVERTKLLWGSPVCYVFLHFLYHLERQLIRQCNIPMPQSKLRLRQMSDSPGAQSSEEEFRKGLCDVRFSLSLSHALSIFAHTASWVTE